MFRLIVLVGIATALAGCVVPAAPPDYGAYPPGYYDAYGYGGDYAPAYAYGTIGVWGGGGGGGCCRYPYHGGSGWGHPWHDGGSWHGNGSWHGGGSWHGEGGHGGVWSGGGHGGGHGGGGSSH